MLEKFRESEADTLAPVLKRICDHLVLLLNPDDGTITQQQLPSNCFGGYNARGLGLPQRAERAAAAHRRAVARDRRAVDVGAAAPSTSAGRRRPAPAPPTEPQPEPEPEPVPVSRTGLSDGVVALACADDGAPAPKRSKSVPVSK